METAQITEIEKIEKPAGSRSKVEVVGLILLGALILYFMVLACLLQAHYYDSFEYFNNAQQMIGIKTRYDFIRPPFLSFLVLPLAVLAKMTGWFSLIDRGSYLLFTTISATTVIVFWRFLRERLAGTAAIFAALALAFNPLYLHYWPFVMSDIVGCLLTLLCWWLITRQQWWQAGLVLGAAFSTRYQLLPLGFLVVCYLAWQRPGDWQNLLKVALKLALISIAVFFLFHSIAFYFGAPELSIFNGLKSVFQQQFRQFGQGGGREGLLARLVAEVNLLAYFVTAPILLIAVIGIIRAFYRRADFDRLNLVWFWGLFLLFGFGISVGSKESRYMFPYLPPLYYFFILGLSTLLEFIDSRQSSLNVRRLIAGLLLLVTAILPIAQGFEQLTRLTEPFYLKPITHQINKSIRVQLNNTEPAFWVGDYLTLAPADYQFSRPERLYYFALFANMLSFYTGRLCYSNFSEQFIKSGNGALVVVNQNPCRDCWTVDPVATQTPLTLHRVTRQQRFRDSGERFNRNIGNQSAVFAVFTSETGEELFVGELGNIIIFTQQSPKANLILQLGYRGEPVPIYADTILAKLPGQLLRSERRSLATIEYVLISELTEPLEQIDVN